MVTQAVPTPVAFERIVDCPFSLAVDCADVVFPLLESAREGVRIPFRALALPISGALVHPVIATFVRRRDETEAGRMHDEIAFEWRARSRWLPNFRGALRFRSETLKTRLILAGSYDPPLGALGAVFDRVLGSRLALATVRDIADRLARALEARWASERK